jgi:hypothetical protein
MGMPGSPDNFAILSQMSRPIKLRHPPQFTVDIVDDARARLEAVLAELSAEIESAAGDIERWGGAVASAGWELASLGQWLGLEGEAVLLLGGASYPEIAEHQGTSQSNVYNRVGKSLTLAPYAKVAGTVTRVSAESLQEARNEYSEESPQGDDVGDDPGESLADRIPVVLGSGALRTTEIVAALADYRRSSVLSTLSLLARQGRILRVGHGVYALPVVESGARGPAGPPQA